MPDIDPDLSLIWMVSGVLAMVWASVNLARSGMSWSRWDALIVPGALLLGPVSLALLLWASVRRPR